MKLVTVFLLIATIVCSSWAYPAGGNPDDDAEVIGNQPGIQFGPTPSIPSFPSIPTFPVVPSIPSIPSIPVYPSQGYPGYPTYPTTVSYVPFGWGYNIFDSFSNIFHRIGDRASAAWSRFPSIRPIVKNYWPDVKTNGTTTSTTKVVGDHKFIINETTHVQQSDFGHVVFKVRTVDIKPLSPEDRTEGVDGDDETTVASDGGAEVPNTTDEPDREPVTEEGDIDIDENVDIDGTAESFGDTNDISRNYINAFENSELTDTTEHNEEIIETTEHNEQTTVDSEETTENIEGTTTNFLNSELVESVESVEQSNEEEPISVNSELLESMEMEILKGAELPSEYKPKNDTIEDKFYIVSEEKIDFPGKTQTNEEFEPNFGQRENDREELEFDLPESEFAQDEIKDLLYADLDNSRPSPDNTFYQVNNNNNESGEELVELPIDLSQDIAINQMLADQGATYDPDAEVFDIHQYESKAHDNSKRPMSLDEKDPQQQQQSFDYLPYHHQTADQRQSIIK